MKVGLFHVDPKTPPHPVFFKITSMEDINTINCLYILELYLCQGSFGTHTLLLSGFYEPLTSLEAVSGRLVLYDIRGISCCDLDLTDCGSADSGIINIIHLLVLFVIIVLQGVYYCTSSIKSGINGVGYGFLCFKPQGTCYYLIKFSFVEALQGKWKNE